MYRVRIADINELPALKDRWNDLVLSMQLPSVFCTWEWMSTWWKHFGQGTYHPLILLVIGGNGIVGILPLALRTMVIEDALLTARTLIIWGGLDVHSDHLDIIAAKEDAPFCLEAVHSFLKKSFTRWDLLYITCLDENSQLLSSVKGNINPLRYQINEVSKAPYIAISQDFQCDYEKYNKTLKPKMRNDPKRRFRILSNDYGITYVDTNPSKPIEALKWIFDLHALRARSKGIKSSFCGEIIESFHMDILHAFSKHNWVKLRFLYDGSRPIAGTYSYVFNGRVYYYQTGLNPDWEPKGPGAVLLYLSITEAFKEHMVEFDFLRGDEQYKDSWTSNARKQFDLRIYNVTLLGLLGNCIFRARSILKREIKKYRRTLLSHRLSDDGL